MSFVAMPFRLVARSSVIDCGFHSHQPTSKGTAHEQHSHAQRAQQPARPQQRGDVPRHGIPADQPPGTAIRGQGVPGEQGEEEANERRRNHDHYPHWRVSSCTSCSTSGGDNSTEQASPFSNTVNSHPSAVWLTANRITLGSGSTGGLLLVGAAQVGPINVGTQVFTADGAARLALNDDGERFAYLLTNADCFSEIANRCLAAITKDRLILRRKAVEVCAQSLHATSLPHGNNYFNTWRQFTKR